MKFVTLFLLPLAFILSLNFFGLRMATEVTGNLGYGIWASAIIVLYYAIIIIWRFRSAAALPIILMSAIFALLFLPVRQNIAVIDYVKTDNSVYWLERSFVTGALKVFVAPDGVVLKAQQLYVHTDVTHEAFLELSPQGEKPVLVYSTTASVAEYQRQVL